MTSLRVTRRQRIEAAHHNGLVTLAESLEIQRGRLKGRQEPDGFTPRIDIRATTSPSHPWKPSLGETERGLVTIGFETGHISGIVATIDGTALDDVTDQEEPPLLTVPASAWKKNGNAERALIMAKVTFRTADFSVETVELVAVPAVPDFRPFTFHKLIHILTRIDGTVKAHIQTMHSLYLDVSDTDKTGRFKAWPRCA